MTWVKLDDQFYTHPKALAVGLHGRALYTAGLCYCSANLTDGTIPKPAVSIVAAMAGTTQSHAKKLVDAGLWEDQGSHYAVHSYLEHQASKDRVEAERARSKQRKERYLERKRNAGGNAQGNAVPDGVGTASERALEVEAETEAEHSSPQPGPAEEPTDREEDLRQTCNLVAQRKLELRRTSGERDPNDAAAWCTTVAQHDADRLRETHAHLREQHPNWTTEDLADELDPDTAPRRSTAMTVEETDAHLEQLDAARREATPMPPEIRQAIRH